MMYKENIPGARASVVAEHYTRGTPRSGEVLDRP